jgi:hypothetical protein
VFDSPQLGTMLVRYSPRVARWIAEREGRVIEEDGTLVIEHPLADPEWTCGTLCSTAPRPRC